MGSFREPKTSTYYAAGAIGRGKAVKINSSGQAVQCSAVSDKSIGVAMNDATAAGDRVEVAMPGGGGKGLAQGSIAAGDPLTSHTDGSLKPVSTTRDRIVGYAEEDAVAGDFFALSVQLGVY